MYDDFIRRVEHDSRRSIEYNRSGTLQVALDESEALALLSDGTGPRRAGVACTLLDAAACEHALEPALSGRVRAALLVPMHGYRCSGIVDGRAR